MSLRVLGERAAILAGLSLVAAYQYVAEARFDRVDMALTSYERAALVGFVAWMYSRSERAI